MHVCDVLHNMIVEDEKDMDLEELTISSTSTSRLLRGLPSLICNKECQR